MKRLRRSAEAEKDVDEIVAYYSRQELALANRFISEYEFLLRSRGTVSGTFLVAELKAAHKGEGVAVTKKETTHRMAEANKAFAHFAW